MLFFLLIFDFVSEELRDNGKDKSEKPKGVKKFGQRILKKFVAAAVTVID